MIRLSMVYAVLTALWLAARRLTGDRPWWLQILNDFTPLGLAPSALMAALAFIRREPLALAATAVPLGTFFGLYGRRYARKPRLGYGGPRLRLMTLNVLCRPRPIDATLAAIREVDADVVLLQELIPRMGHPLGQALLEEYPYQAVYPAESARGTAVLSKLPFASEERFLLSSEGWYCQDVRFRWAGRSLALFNIHLLRPELKLTPRADWHPFDSRDRAAEMKRLLERVRLEQHDVIVAGDFNMTDQSSDYRDMHAVLNDAFIDAGRGFGFTYPAQSPYGKFWFERHAPAFLRLDHVFYQGRLRARSAHVGPNGDSDHASLVVELEAIPER